MKILVAHNSYQRPGGEDAVCESEIRLLREAGHEVVEYLRHNGEIEQYSFLQQASLGWRTSWSHRTDRELRDILARKSPDVAHFHNTFPLISPSAYYACRSAGVAVVQTLHNFRLLCPGGNLFRHGAICEECISHSLVRSIAHACYRESRVASAAVAGMLTLHRLLRTWSEQVDLFLVCSEFARKKFADAGFHETRLRVKPNFIAADPGARFDRGTIALYIGRLSAEKGPQLLPRSWSKLSEAIPLEIVGDGPLRDSLEQDCARLRRQTVHFSGWLRPSAAMERLRAAKFLIVPSTCYEGFPLAVAEAYACGVPVIAAGHGGLAEIVRDGCTGLHFTPGDAEDLAAKVEWAWTHPLEMETMGWAARVEFDTKYNAGAALKHLEAAYESALSGSKRAAPLDCDLIQTEPRERMEHQTGGD
jgi:glycosyltransferase involved in cell wall biosynthesis